MPFMFRLAAAAAFFLPAACGPNGAEATPCSSNGDCSASYACDLGVTQQCLRACTVQTDCLNSEHCTVPNGQTQGFCRFGDPNSSSPTT